MTLKNLSVFGLGKLGSPLAIALAARGFRVVGVDEDAAKIEAINQGRPPVFEPGLSELLPHTASRLSATNDGTKAVEESDVSFIVVPTPSEPDGSYSLRHVLKACEVIAKAIVQKDSFHVVVLTSTVSPGSTGGRVRETLQEASGRIVGEGLGLCYSPEFIALGSVIHDLVNPDFVLIGESDPRSGDELEEIYRTLCENNPPAARMNFVNAEIAKLSVNTFVTTKISFANMLAQICQRLPEADVDVVTNALGLDSRIGRKYLKGGIAFGGPCFPRDNQALVSLARSIGAPALIAEATDQVNAVATKALAELTKSKLPTGGSVGILGLSYKPNTDVVEKSQGILLAEALSAEGVPVLAFDPAALENARLILGDRVKFLPSLEQCLEGADVVVIATAWDDFRGVDVMLSNGISKPAAVIDCWNILDAERVRVHSEYVPIGVGPKI